MAPSVLDTADDVVKPPPLKPRQETSRAPAPPPKDTFMLPTSSSDVFRANRSTSRPLSTDFAATHVPPTSLSSNANRGPRPVPPKDTGAPTNRTTDPLPDHEAPSSVHSIHQRSSSSTKHVVEAQQRARDQFHGRSNDNQPSPPLPPPKQSVLLTNSRRKSIQKWFGFGGDDLTAGPTQTSTARNRSTTASSVATDPEPRRDSLCVICCP